MRRRGARLLLALLCARLGRAKLIERHFNGPVSRYAHGDRDMAYIGKFAFQCVGECSGQPAVPDAEDDVPDYMQMAESGLVRVAAHGGYEPGQVLAVYMHENYFDPARAWRNVYQNKHLTCAQKLGKAVDVIQLSPALLANASESYILEHMFDDHEVHRVEYIQLSARPQFFHFAAMNCGSGALHAFVELKLFNPGAFRTRQFSFEDQGLLGLETIMLVLAVLLALTALEGVLSLRANRLHHPPLQIVHGALWLLVLSHALAVHFYSSYATFGRGPEFALFSSEMLALAADLIIMVLCLLIARGWRVAAGELQREEAMLILGAACFYALVYGLVYCADMATRDPAEDVYPLMTGGALWLVFFRLCMGGLCVRFVLRTYNLEMSQPKRAFYRNFVGVSVLWFLTQPIAIVLALCMDELLRHKNATLILHAISHGLLALILRVLRPAKAAGTFAMTAYADELDGLVTGASRPPNGPSRSGAAEWAADGYGQQVDEPEAGRGKGGPAGAWREERPAARYRDDEPSHHVEMQARRYEREESPRAATPEPVRPRPQAAVADLLGGGAHQPGPAAGPVARQAEGGRAGAVAEEQDGML